MPCELGAAAPAAHIWYMVESTSRGKCPICGKPAEQHVKPFCSRRCADVDLHRWLTGSYAIAATDDEEEDERRDDGATLD